MTDPEISELAYHEAGHAVVAAWLGAEVVLVTLEPEDDDGPVRDGDTTIRWHRRGLSTSELMIRELMAVLAGPVFEMTYAGIDRHLDRHPPWDADWRLAQGLAAGLANSPAGAAKVIETTLGRIRELADQEPFWQTVAEVADLLEAHESVSGDEVHACLTRWLGSRGHDAVGKGGVF